MSGFKLNFESQFEMHNAIFCLISAYSSAVAGKQSKKKRQGSGSYEVYLINNWLFLDYSCNYAC